MSQPVAKAVALEWRVRAAKHKATAADLRAIADKYLNTAKSGESAARICELNAKSDELRRTQEGQQK